MTTKNETVTTTTDETNVNATEVEETDETTSPIRSVLVNLPKELCDRFHLFAKKDGTNATARARKLIQDWVESNEKAS